VGRDFLVFFGVGYCCGESDAMMGEIKDGVGMTVKASESDEIRLISDEVPAIRYECVLARIEIEFKWSLTDTKTAKVFMPKDDVVLFEAENEYHDNMCTMRSKFGSFVVHPVEDYETLKKRLMGR